MGASGKQKESRKEEVVSKKTPSTRGMKLSLTLVAITGVAFIILTFFPMSYVPHMGALGVLGLVSALGLFKGKRWGFYIGLALVSIYITIGASLLYFTVAAFSSLTEVSVALACTGLALFTALMVAVLFFIASRRKFFH